MARDARQRIGDKASALRLLLRSRVPAWVTRVASLVAIYVVFIWAVASWVPAWHDWDWRFYDWLSSRAVPTFSQDITIVDVVWSPSAIPADRVRIASFLHGLTRANVHPEAVILDFEFGPCDLRPCPVTQRSARDALAAAIQDADRVFPVFATEEFPVNAQDDIAVGPLDPEDQRIYSALSGAAHTRFTSLPNKEGLFYRVCYPEVPFVDSAGDVEGNEDVWSMVDRVLLLPARAGAVMPACDTAHVALRMGPKVSPTAPAVYHFVNESSFSNYEQLEGAYVIVGTLKYDRSPFADRSGPELLGWALSNSLEQGLTPGYYDVQPQNELLRLLIPGFSAFAVLVYAGAFFLLRRTRLRSARRALPWLASCLAAVIGLGIFIAFESWMFVSHHIQPQVSLIALGVVAASMLSGVRGAQVLHDDASAMERVSQETYDYDVFISYAREDGAWVYENVYVPLRDAVLPGGKKLAVFFDTASIRGGSGWQSKIAFSIDASRFIVPVYTETYFAKAYCRFEIMRAHRKWIHDGPESRCVLPVRRGRVKVYGPVDDIQAPSIDDYPNLVQEYVAEIVARLSKVRV
jgi:hypothetical protein